jgi:hypothetical protein
MTIWEILDDLRKHPGTLLVRRWNWKSAAFSSTLRAGIFFATNLGAGLAAATGAMEAEFFYRALTAGFYGALTQAFRSAEPAWAACAVVMIALPLASHSIELAVHLLRGTPRILESLTASACFTAISTLFNLYAMRRGALVVGAGAGTVGSDLRRMPRLIGGFIAAGPLVLYKTFSIKNVSLFLNRSDIKS